MASRHQLVDGQYTFPVSLLSKKKKNKSRSRLRYSDLLNQVVVAPFSPTPHNMAVVEFN